MKKVKWYSLPALPTLLIVIAGTVLLVLSFTRETGAFLRYFSYLFSTYALIIGVSGLIRFFQWVSRSVPETRVMKKLHNNTHAARYLDDPFFRTEINLYFGTAVNALYIFIKFFSGLYLRSGWLIAFALYYTVLTILRTSLAQFVRQNEFKQDIRAEYRRYRLVGILLLGMNIVLSGIISRMIALEEAVDYPGVLVYAVAAYTFYAVIIAVVGLIQYRRHGSPVISAIKVVNLTAAMMAMLSLEATMLHHFGGDDGRFRATMLGVSGFVASIIILSLSIYMILHATKKIRRFSS